MRDENKTCQVCLNHPVTLPHSVCHNCYERLYAFEKRVHYAEYTTSEWEELVGDGLKVVIVMIEIVDDIEPTPADKEWHKRRIAFMYDLIGLLDKSLFLPATSEQVDFYRQQGVDFWNGKISKQEAKQLVEECLKTLSMDIFSDTWNAKGILTWMLETEESFDWMWYQWFTCLYSSLEPNLLNENEWIHLFQKHFSDVIQDWCSDKVANK